MQIQYVRLNVYDYINEFCGWEPISELTKYAETPTKELYLLSLIKTGGRAGEVLELQKENFNVNKRTKTIFVQNMKLEKRWKLVKHPDGTRERQHIEALRKPFPILLEEPLSTELLSHLEHKQGPLFLSPYRHNDPYYSVSWGYKFIRNLNDTIPRTLFNQLGLNQQFNKKVLNPETNTMEIVKHADTIHLWQHWFRAQRASQLRSEYNYSEADLMEFFGWLDYKTALHYSRLGATNLAKKARVAMKDWSS